MNFFKTLFLKVKFFRCLLRLHSSTNFIRIFLLTGSSASLLYTNDDMTRALQTMPLLCFVHGISFRSYEHQRTRRVLYICVQKKFFKWIGRRRIQIRKNNGRSFQFHMKKSNCMPIKIYITTLRFCVLCSIDSKANRYFLKIGKFFLLKKFNSKLCERKKGREWKSALSLLLFILLFVFIFRPNWIKMRIFSFLTTN